jgi:hypothetical protein
MIFTLFVCLAGFSLGMAACGESAECGSDTDCKGDRICDDGNCEDPGGSSGGTTSGGSTSGGSTSGGSTSGGSTSGGTTGGESQCMSSSDCQQIVCNCVDGPVNFTGCNVVNGVGTCATTSNCASEFDACEGEGGGTTGGSTGDSSGGSTGGSKEVGDGCANNEECATGWCLFEPGADFGYCTKECESFSDCPSFWECKKPSNASSKFCFKDD